MKYKTCRYFHNRIVRVLDTGEADMAEGPSNEVPENITNCGIAISSTLISNEGGYQRTAFWVPVGVLAVSATDMKV